MKTKFLAVGLIVAFIGIFIFSSCKKEMDEVPLNQSIVGKWNFTSFKLDTSEYIGTVIESAYIEYKAPVNNKAEFTQSVVFADSDADVISGEYTVNINTKSITMSTESKIISSTVTISDNTMEWVSSQDGKPLIIKAVKE
jgi:hypothetical protein